MAFKNSEEAVRLQVLDMFTQTFHRVIPPDNRIWLSDMVQIDVLRRMESFSIEVRIMAKPTHDVVPQAPIAMSWAIDGYAADQMIIGHHPPIVDEHVLTDFCIKMLLVYAKKEE